MKIRKLVIYDTALLFATNKTNVSALISTKSMRLQEAIFARSYDID